MKTRTTITEIADDGKETERLSMSAEGAMSSETTQKVITLLLYQKPPRKRRSRAKAQNEE